jgi:hypothetical protein
MKHKTSQPFLLHKHGVISCAIAKGVALRERRNDRLLKNSFPWVSSQRGSIEVAIVASGCKDTGSQGLSRRD